MNARVASVPQPRYDHLLRLIDGTGLFEHARFGVARRRHGYTTDDAARALVVLVRADESSEIDRAIHTLLGFVIDAVCSETGLVRNRLGFDRRWTDAPHEGDHHGRALWSLGVTAASARRPEWREAARAVFAELTLPGVPHLRPLALAALGAVEVHRLDPSDVTASAIIDRAVDRLSAGGRPWPEPRLSYANGRIPHAMLDLADATGDSRLRERGVEALTWLHEVERRDGHYSFTPVGGWEPGDPRPGFDQQPIEAAAMASAALAAWRVTGERRWAGAVMDAGRWLTGSNDVGAVLVDPETGGCFDGLESGGVNANQGAESTIAGLEVLQACQTSRTEFDPWNAGADAVVSRVE